MAESRKIISIIPAAPGWRAEYCSEETVSYLVPIACWALVQYENDEGEVYSTGVVPVTPSQILDDGTTMWVGDWDADGSFDVIGVAGPEEEYPRQLRGDAGYSFREKIRRAEEIARARAGGA